ncbi:MAG: galactokinase [Ruminococcus sp.]|nr:galactokinase [Ruminococcus sp.]
MKSKEFIEKIQAGELDEQLKKLYGNSTEALDRQRARYIEATEEFAKLFPQHEEIHIYSAPGRTEVGGNHTDHQHGCVFAGAVNLDVIAVVAFHNEGVIRLKSAGYPQDNVELSDLSVHSDETGKSASIIRGIASKFTGMGVEIGGFDAYTTSDVLSGSGLSSSASFEVLVGTIIDKHYNAGKAGAVEIAKIGQYAENVYFGKGSGLMDQMVSSVGGFVFIDFEDTADPVIKAHSFDFEKAGYKLCITDTKGSHSDLTDDYVSVPTEMKSVAKQFGKEYLRAVDENEFYEKLPQLRENCTDRALMRASHFFSENKRAMYEAQALEKGDINEFLALVNQSGDSSANLLQNLYSCKNPQQQAIPLAIMLSKRVLAESGAVRVHGGGFAGTIQAFVPVEKAEEYSTAMNSLFGEGSCHILRIRPVGGIEIA